MYSMVVYWWGPLSHCLFKWEEGHSVKNPGEGVTLIEHLPDLQYVATETRPVYNKLHIVPVEVDFKVGP